MYSAPAAEISLAGKYWTGSDTTPFHGVCDRGRIDKNVWIHDKQRRPRGAGKSTPLPLVARKQERRGRPVWFFGQSQSPRRLFP
jgi:hypothetical protein